MGAVHKGKYLTACVDTASLWATAVQQAAPQTVEPTTDTVDCNRALAGKLVLPSLPDLKVAADAARLRAELARLKAQDLEGSEQA